MSILYPKGQKVATLMWRDITVILLSFLDKHCQALRNTPPESESRREQYRHSRIYSADEPFSSDWASPAWIYICIDTSEVPSGTISSKYFPPESTGKAENIFYFHLPSSHAQSTSPALKGLMQEAVLDVNIVPLRWVNTLNIPTDKFKLYSKPTLVGSPNENNHSHSRRETWQQQ